MTSLPRDADLSGCPTEWARVPLLPHDRVPMFDRDGYGTLWRVKVHGLWWLLKFLPGGRVSAADQDGGLLLVGSLEQFALILRDWQPPQRRELERKERLW